MTCISRVALRFIFVLTGFTFFCHLLAQDEPAMSELGEMIQPELFCLCQLRGDIFSLRWAPNTAALVRMGINQGYNVRRTTYLQNGDSLVTSTILSLPTRDEFLALNSELKNVDGAAGLLYEKLKANDLGPGILGSYSRHEYLQMNAGMLLYMADLDFGLARALNLGWEEEVDTLNVRTKYSISLNGTSLSTAIFQNSGKCTQIAKPINQFFAIPDDQSIALTWDIYYNESGYIGFFIERSSDSVKWSRLNELPIAIVDQGDTERQHWITYVDSVKENYKPYYYRLQGITSFGRPGPYSRLLMVEASPPLEINSPYILGAHNVGDTSLSLHWRISGKDSMLIDQIVVMRAPHPDSAFIEIAALEGSKRHYLDDPILLNSYYIIQATDKEGRVYTGSLAHGQLPDKTPPAVPLEVIATVDTVGNVDIRWAENLEPDLSGYRVFYKRYLSDEEIQLTTASIRESRFSHSVNLKMLNHEIYYQVSAEDKAGNRSMLSAPIQVILPDTIAPSSPVLLSTKSETSGCLINYTLSGSTDVRCHVLLRKILSDDLWLPVDTITPQGNQMQQSVDSLLDPGQNIAYQLIAIDSSGNETKSNTLIGRRIDTKIRAAPVNAIYTWRKRNQELTFEWSYRQEMGIKAIRIYHKDPRNGKYLTYKYLRLEDINVKPESKGLSKFSYLTKGVEKEKITDYRIRIDFEDGAISRSANFVESKK